MDSFALKGRVAVVTGAASGIGQAIAKTLLELGVIVGALDRNTDGIPDGCCTLLADVRDHDAVTHAVTQFAEKHGRIDILVNNAGVSFVGTIEQGSEQDWMRVLDINLLGQMRVMRAALPFLRQSDAASVISMSSCTATNGIPERALYSASKGAVHSMTLAMATDLLAENIRVNCISPATVDTPFMTELANRATDPVAKRRTFNERQPTGKMVDPAELGFAVAYLASPLSGSTTGTTLVLDGGMGTLRIPKYPGASENGKSST